MYTGGERVPLAMRRRSAEAEREPTRRSREACREWTGPGSGLAIGTALRTREESLVLSCAYRGLRVLAMSPIMPLPAVGGRKAW